MKTLVFRNENVRNVMCSEGIVVEHVQSKENYILAYLGNSQVCLINLKFGRYWSRQVTVEDVSGLTWPEWEKVTDNQPDMFVLSNLL
jgi:hypothetical protein